MFSIYATTPLPEKAAGIEAPKQDQLLNKLDAVRKMITVGNEVVSGEKENAGAGARAINQHKAKPITVDDVAKRLASKVPTDSRRLSQAEISGEWPKEVDADAQVSPSIERRGGPKVSDEKRASLKDRFIQVLSRSGGTSRLAKMAANSEGVDAESVAASRLAPLKNFGSKIKDLFAPIGKAMSGALTKAANALKPQSGKGTDGIPTQSEKPALASAKPLADETPPQETVVKVLDVIKEENTNSDMKDICFAMAVKMEENPEFKEAFNKVCQSPGLEEIPKFMNFVGHLGDAIRDGLDNKADVLAASMLKVFKEHNIDPSLCKDLENNKVLEGTNKYNVMLERIDQEFTPMWNQLQEAVKGYREFNF